MKVMTLPRLRFVAILTGLVLVIAGGVFGVRLLEEKTRFTAVFESAVGLYPGSDVQILGVPVGRVTAVDPDGKQVRVTMELDDGQRVAAETAAVIVAPTLVSDRYVQLTEPYVGGAQLEAEAEITATAVPVEIDELYESLTDMGKKMGPEGVNRNGSLSDFLEVVAANLDGQGGDINTMLTEFGKATATVSGFDEDFFATIAHLDTFNTTLLENDEGIADANRQLAVVAKYLADDRRNLALAVRNLGGALSVLEGFIEDNRGALTRSVKALRGPTQVLVNQRKALDEAVRTVPLALQNFLRAYDVRTNTVSGRGNLNELTVWSRDGKTARTSAEAPPVLLPGLGEGE
jgi:phospholipid/cholesterol/gamma-HCH transport system substrate-binding protein